jgi:hypothetical protein
VLFEIHQCIVDASMLQNSGYAIYKIQEPDPLLAYALTISESGVVKEWLYESHTTGATGLPISRMNNLVCENPSSNSNLEVLPLDLFSCSR